MPQLTAALERCGKFVEKSAPCSPRICDTRTITDIRTSQPAARRQAAMPQLIQAPPSVVPVLLDALTDADPGARYGVAYVLDSQRAPEGEETCRD